LIFDAVSRRTEPQHPTKLAHRGALVARDWRIRAHFFRRLSQHHQIGLPTLVRALLAKLERTTSNVTEFA
jgi:hypothetical protein